MLPLRPLEEYNIREVVQINMLVYYDKAMFLKILLHQI